jgi:hypothetical protein
MDRKRHAAVQCWVALVPYVPLLADIVAAVMP